MFLVRPLLLLVFCGLALAGTYRSTTRGKLQVSSKGRVAGVNRRSGFDSFVVVLVDVTGQTSLFRWRLSRLTSLCPPSTSAHAVCLPTPEES